MSCDGEAKQIEVFQEPDILELLRANLIDLAKTPASCSAICQSSDASKFFKASKKRLSHQSIDLNPLDNAANKASVGQLKTAVGDRFAANKKLLVIKALLKVVIAIRATLTQEIVQDGYEVIGQYPIDFERAMAQCPSVKYMNKKHYEHMKNKVEELAGIFREKGILTEQDMDDSGIVEMTQDSRTAPKDERVLHQQRAVLMNSDECVRQYKIHQERTRAKKTAAASSGGASRKDNVALYKQWLDTLSAEEMRAEKEAIKEAGGKVIRRNIKAVELRAANWVPPLVVDAATPTDDEI